LTVGKFVGALLLALVGGLTLSVDVYADPGLPDPLPSGTSAGSCSAWVPVNEGAFGMGTGSCPNYTSEEGFEVAVYEGQLYLGMEADNMWGARIWRTRPGVNIADTQTDWEEVAAVNGEPFGDATTQDGIYRNDHIDSLVGFRGALYASTANGGSTTQGTMVYSSTTGASGTWVPVIEPGFGDVNNVNFKDMHVLDGWLCGGTQNGLTGTQVWCTQDGAAWVLKNDPGFGVPRLNEIWSGHVYDGALYFGAQQKDACLTSAWQDDTGYLYRTTSLDADQPTWTPVFTGPVGSYRIDVLGDLGGYLYISHRDPEEGIVILRSAGGDAGSWQVVNVPGMDGTGENMGTVVDGATTYNGALYVAVANLMSGAQVWRTTGRLDAQGRVDWEPVGGPGLDNGDNYYAELVVYKGYLYAWTSNYVTGQQVLRTACPIVQDHVMDGPGVYDFPGVGATITFTLGAPETVTVSVLPGAFPTLQREGLPVARTFFIESAPDDAVFEADLRLAFHAPEMDESDISGGEPYLMRWTGQAWWECEHPGGYDASDYAVTCLGVEQFSPWVIAGIGGTPNHVGLTRAVGSSPLDTWLLVTLGGVAIVASAAVSPGQETRGR
jgi:hypothetical protein